jgi:integrase
VLEAECTKTSRADERPVPDLLDEALARYLGEHRPALLGRPGEEPEPGSLWVSVAGEPLSYSATTAYIAETTRQALGVAVNPHAFRMAAASTAAYRAGADPGLASALLQHTDRRTTDLHYTRATSLQAGIVFGQIVRRYSR